MKITMAILADAVNISQDGKLNLLGAFQSVITPQVPCVHLHFVIVLVFRLDFEEKNRIHNCWIRIVDSDHHEIYKGGPFKFEVPASDISTIPESKVIVNFQMLQFFQFGSHVIEVYINREPQCDHPDYEMELLVQPHLQRIEEK